MDPLHFDDLILQPPSHYVEVAEESIWRTDLEITMVLISNTLACIFVWLQILHVKRNPEVSSFISLAMLLTLCAGHMIPLVLYHNNSKSARLEANEVAVRVMAMVALLLHIRLLQLVWSSKHRDVWIGEKKAGVVSLALYVSGGLLALRSYGGVILDGFLLPQILLNIFTGSSEKALCNPFYIGTSTIRLVPHVYNQYRAHNYPKFDPDATYYYANPAADLYSTAWDIIIPCGVVAMAVIVFVQQQHGGHCFLPQKFR